MTAREKTDLEITRLCAEAMGIDVTEQPPPGICVRDKVWLLHNWHKNYDPLNDKAQALDLVIKFKLTVEPDEDGDWGATHWDELGMQPTCGASKDLLRAICLCVAKMREASAA